MKRSRNRSPSLPPAGEATHNELSALNGEERKKFLCFVRTKLADGDPLIRRIDRAVEMISPTQEYPVDEAMADEVKETELAAGRAIEALKEEAGRELARITEKYRRARLDRMEQFLSARAIDPSEWNALQEEFRAAHEENPELQAWIYINESPLPSGPGSLHFRQLANRAAWALARVAGMRVGSPGSTS